MSRSRRTPVKAQMTSAGMLAEVKHDERHIAFRDLLDNDGRYQIHPALATIRRMRGRHPIYRRHDRLAQGRDADPRQSDRGLLALHRSDDARRTGPARGRGAFPMHPAALPHLFAHRRHAARLQVGRGARPSSALRSRSRGQGHRRKEDHRLHGRADDACRDPQRARSRTAWIFRRCAYVRRAGAPLPVAVQERFEKCRRLPVDRRLGHDGDVADRHIHAARAAAVRPGSCGIPYPGTRDEIRRRRRPEPRGQALASAARSASRART